MRPVGAAGRRPLVLLSLVLSSMVRGFLDVHRMLRSDVASPNYRGFVCIILFGSRRVHSKARRAYASRDLGPEHWHLFVPVALGCTGYVVLGNGMRWVFLSALVHAHRDLRMDGTRERSKRRGGTGRRRGALRIANWVTSRGIIRPAAAAAPGGARCALPRLDIGEEKADPAADRGVYWGAYRVVVAICSARRRAPHAAPLYKKKPR